MKVRAETADVLAEAARQVARKAFLNRMSLNQTAPAFGRVIPTAGSIGEARWQLERECS